MTTWRGIAPDGETSTFDATDDIDACERHDMFACALVGCPDAHGWRFVDTATGRTLVPEEIDAAPVGKPLPAERLDEMRARFRRAWEQREP